MRYWSLTETGDLTANLDFNYLQADVPATVIHESRFRLYRYEGTFSQIPSLVDPDANTVSTIGISEFSDWTFFAQLGPTAANVSVSGRVIAANGQGVGNSLVTLTANDGSVISGRTSSFGYFQVENVPAGQGYVLEVKHIRGEA